MRSNSLDESRARSRGMIIALQLPGKSTQYRPKQLDPHIYLLYQARTSVAAVHVSMFVIASGEGT